MRITKIITPVPKGSFLSCSGLTLVEVIIAMALAGITISALISGYVVSAHRMEWAAQNAAAEVSAMNTMERLRAAKWDTRTSPPIDNLVNGNFPPRVEAFNLPTKGTNILYGTNYVTIIAVSSDPPLKFIRVDCVWSSLSGELFTNRVLTYRSPDQ